MQKKISDIVIDETIYPRADFDPDTVERYREAMTAGAIFPPIVITQDNRLLDGRHRLEAYKLVGAAEVEVTIEDPADPAARAVELNLHHGKPLTKGEMKELARKWYGTRPVTEIANVLGVTRQTVQNWVSDLAAERSEAREEIREKALRMRVKGMTQEEIAGQLGVTRQAISKWESNSVKNLTPLQENNTKGACEEYPNVKNVTHEYSENDSDRINDGQAENQLTCYVHNGREIFISKGLGNEYGTFWRSPDGGLHRVKSPAMPMVESREEAQSNLNQWAAKKGLQAVCSNKPDVPLKARANLDVDQEDNPEYIDDYGGREAAESFRKKILPYSDAIKEFYQQLKKASDLAEQITNRREDMIEAIAEMQPDGVSITILANAVIQACDIYIPRFVEVKETLQEVIKPGIKGVTTRDKFLVVNGGKTNGN
ncbi:helix-turn-helix domain-containing protein [Desulfotruncus alcoholivorax]|uniref:helix-turn-helix domain-containing protein n=1 Tax=Desulfotruncus alcoholivorax TaxID=265477 RepID=UPI00041DEF17|nr:helix-turn-helix domain-containing protein [Desulfotruncus alcoholivorax]